MRFPRSSSTTITSPNLLDFVAANLRLIAITQGFGIAFVYGRDPWTRWGIGWKFALFPLLLLYTIAMTSCFHCFGSSRASPTLSSSCPLPTSRMQWSRCRWCGSRRQIRRNSGQATTFTWGWILGRWSNTHVSAAGVRGRSAGDLRSVRAQGHLALLGTGRAPASGSRLGPIGSRGRGPRVRTCALEEGLALGPGRAARHSQAPPSNRHPRGGHWLCP